MRVKTFFAAMAIAMLCGPLARPAAAMPVTIGDFAFDNDVFFGPSFTIFNTASDATSLGDPAATFENIVVQLFSGTTEVHDIVIGSLAAGGSVQTFEDLTPFTFDSATVTFLFSVAGSLDIPPLVALDFTDTSHADAFIQLTPATDVPVPEPTTLLATGTGLALTAFARRRRRR